MEAARRGEAEISCKGEYRRIILAEKLCKTLLAYAAENDIKAGCIFITRTGRPVDRSNVAREMKRLADNAGVAKAKVFPHNFRHLFARTFYSAYKDIVRLADILGHSSIDTTRIYTRESGDGTSDRVYSYVMLIPGDVTVTGDNVTVEIGSVTAKKHSSFAKKFEAVTGGDVTFTAAITQIPEGEPLSDIKCVVSVSYVIDGLDTKDEYEFNLE